MNWKILTVFTILLNSILIVSACGPYFPSGEDIRFNMLRPEVFKCYGYNAFNLSGHIYYVDNDDYHKYLNETSNTDLNVVWWQSRYQNKFTYDEIYTVLYEQIQLFNADKTDNKFITYLIKNDSAAYTYLKFLAANETISSYDIDPWERPEYDKHNGITPRIDLCLTRSAACKDVDLKKRYAFIGLRFAYYINDSSRVAQIFDAYFRNTVSPDIIDYWAMHFYAKRTDDDIQSNFYAAQAFRFSPEKRIPVFATFEPSCPKSDVLKLARNKSERGAVEFLYALKNPAYALPEIKNMYAANPSDEALTFILLREMNKLEFWIYTQYFFNYKPDFKLCNWYNADSNLYAGWRSMQKDKTYASDMLAFVNHANLDRVHDKSAWQFSKAYLQFMTDDYQGAKRTINHAEKILTDTSKVFEQFERLKLYVLAGLQTDGKPVITGAMQPILEKQINKKDYKYIFGLARLLEINGNTTEAVILMSHVNNTSHWDDNNVFWKSGRKLIYREGFYLTYLYYLDAQYSKQQLKNIIYSIENRKDRSAFGDWFYSEIEKNLYAFYDLVGMKYIRINELNKALYYFKAIPDSFWQTNSNYDFVDFSINPFDIGLFKSDTITYTKAKILETLLYNLQKANNVHRNDRDYYYFLVANCYYNMTSYGNSWMMRRLFGGSRYLKDSKLEDMDEYYSCNMAKMYYLKAKSVSNSKKFSALALRFAGKCESNRLTYLKHDDYLSDEEEDAIFQKNSYYKQLARKYPDYYKDIMSNCTVMAQYFNAR